MSVSVIIPFYGNNELRRTTLRAVELHHLTVGFGYTVAPGTSAAKCRNNGVRMTRGSVLLFNDADSICDSEQIREAVTLAATAPGLVFAYTGYHRLSEASSVPGEIHWSAPGLSGSSGCVAISRDSFLEVGGYDESYKGRGFEDLDFAERCSRLWPLRRVDGDLFHLWHGERREDDSPEDQDPAEQEANRLLYQALIAP